MERLGSLFAPAVPGGLLTGLGGKDHCDPGIHHVSKGTLRGQCAQMTCHLSKLVQACVLGEVPFGNGRRVAEIDARGSCWKRIGLEPPDLLQCFAQQHLDGQSLGLGERRPQEKLEAFDIRNRDVGIRHGIASPAGAGAKRTSRASRGGPCSLTNSKSRLSRARANAVKSRMWHSLLRRREGCPRFGRSSVTRSRDSSL